jgi:RNA 2',3'-cyclic 3'-phosphodiesterase
MRAFIAIEIPPAVKAALADCRAELQRLPAEAGWTRPGNIHLTLKFLGEVPERSQETIAEAMREAAAGAAQLCLELAGLGAFPSWRRPRVLWAGLAGEVEAAKRLQARLEELLDKGGFPPEGRAFAPHLTLARLRSVEDARTWAQTVEAYRLPPLAFAVDRIVLFRSELHPAGARYTELAAELLGRQA